MKNTSRKLLVFPVILMFLFSCKKQTSPDEGKDDQTAETGQQEVEIYKVDVGNSIFTGPQNAPVTIINFSDFQCPFSKKSIDHIDKLMKTYDGKIRYVFKHFPLPFHKMAKPASLAAIAAEKQGKFWEYYNILYSNMKEISDENLILWAEKTGLDKEKFLSDRNSNDAANTLKLDTSTGSRFGVRGTPTIFINGRRIVGANNNIIDSVVREEIAKGEKLRAKGVKNIYAELTKNGLVKYTPPKRKPRNIPKDIYKIEFPDTAPILGNENADITIVVFNDYECHFCSRLHSTLEEIRNEYGDTVRVVYINLPLRFHKKAVSAALAVFAAERQGKFQEMNDLLFKKQNEWKKADNFKEWVEKEAGNIGLNLQKFNTDITDPGLIKLIETDKKFANKLGVRGTPASFINGRYLSGALPLDSFKEVIVEELQRVETVKNDALKGDKLYLELIKNGKPGLTGAAQDEKKNQNGNEIVEIKLTGKEPSLGPGNAPVTIIEFSDFQCPFCKKGASIVEKLVEEYKGKVNLIFKHTPLDFNKNAKKAALFTIAVKNIYGDKKFFEMEKILFNNQNDWKISPEKHFEEYALTLELDWNKIQKEMENPETQNILEKDVATAAEHGVKGVPVFFINGKRVTGVKNSAYFKAIIDTFLKEKEAVR